MNNELQIENFRKYVLELANESAPKKLKPISDIEMCHLIEKLFNIWKEKQFYCETCKTNIGCSYMNFGVKCKVEEDFENNKTKLSQH